MVHAVLFENRHLYQDAVLAMHRDRKTIFVDRLKWDVPVVDGQYEIDQFDTTDAVYLLALDPVTRAHLGSARLLPTTQPHLLGSIFPHLCDGEAPVGEDVWEITRLCTSPALAKDDARKVLGRIKTALIEFALLYGISRYTCMAHMQWLSQLLAVGWHAEPLGLPQDCDGEVVGAIVIHVTPATLQLFRERAGSRAPILRLVSREAA